MDAFPRHLSRTEYARPYEVFSKCFRHRDIHQWQELLEDMFHAAAHDGPPAQGVQDDDLYQAFRCLFKLTEACQLLKVREIEPFLTQEADTA